MTKNGPNESSPIRTVMDAYSSKIELAYNGSREDLDPYVPANHRPLESNTSSFGALAHLLKASLGSGVLAMPLAFKNAGLLVGSVGTILIGLICGHAIHILTILLQILLVTITNIILFVYAIQSIGVKAKHSLRGARQLGFTWLLTLFLTYSVRTSQKLCEEIKRPSLGYADTCDLVFQNGPKPVQKYAPYARELADWALAVTHLGACCVYVVVIAESFKQVSDEYGGPEWSVTAFCGLTLVVLIPLTQISKLKYLVPFSALANFVWLGSICICIYYCLRDPPPVSSRNAATSITGLPNFISTSLFAMEGIGVVMPIENEMIKPGHFLGCPGVLNIAMTAVVMLYGFVGFCGYLNFGEQVRGSLTLNLPQDEILAQTAKILVACVMVLSFALIFYVPVDVVWRRIQNKIPAKGHRWSMAGLRLVGTLFAVGLASAIPRLELFMELVGAVCLSVMGLTLPAISDTVFRWGKDLGSWHWVLWKNCAIILFSLVAMVSGVTFSIKSMINNL